MNHLVRNRPEPHQHPLYSGAESDLVEEDDDVEGEEAKIAFNGRYLTDVLSVLKIERSVTVKQPDGHLAVAQEAAQVALEVTSPSNPGVIRPVSADNYIHVIMPMFVQW